MRENEKKNSTKLIHLREDFNKTSYIQKKHGMGRPKTMLFIRI